ncbi:MAG: hypothetical protein ACFCU1_12470 [Sumerlaeia bacterium]
MPERLYHADKIFGDIVSYLEHFCWIYVGLQLTISSAWVILW